MFAGAAREVVFSNPEIVGRINQEFIPVAVKAAKVNQPPSGPEGRLYAEIARSRPAPQGICSVNSAGRVLAWTLSFEDHESIGRFLDHVLERYQAAPDGPTVAERYTQFPNRKLDDLPVANQTLVIPPAHLDDQPCPGNLERPRGTLVGRIVGRQIDNQGVPTPQTALQEQYMESTFDIPDEVQTQLAAIVRQTGDQPFELPHRVARCFVNPAHLGQLDVNPLGTIPGSRNVVADWQFTAKRVPSDTHSVIRLRIDGYSNIEGEQDRVGNRLDERFWEHRVTLQWQGYLDVNIERDRIVQVSVLADGDERLRWGHASSQLSPDGDPQQLMAGHRIDLETRVRYGLSAPAND